MPVQIQMAQPADLAGDYLRGVQTGAQIKEAKQRLDQQSAETSARLQAQAQQQAQEHAVEQQRIQVSQAYHQQQAALRKQQLDQVEAVNAQKTASAARQFAARQTWEQGLAKIDADQTMDPAQKDAAKTQFVMRLAPSMGMAGTEAAAFLRDMRPPKPTVPSKVEDKGDFLQVTEPTGGVQIHFKPREPKSAAEKDPNVKVLLPDQPGPTTMPRSQALRVIPDLPDEFKTNAVNKAVMSGAPTVSAPVAPPKASDGKRVRVRHPDGTIGTIDADKVDKALAAG